MSVKTRTTLDMVGNPISNVADPTNPQDAATRAWVLTLAGLYEVQNGGAQPTDGSDLWIDWSGG